MKQFPELLENDIAHHMAKTIIDDLEIIDIGKNAGQWKTVALRTRKLVFETAMELLMLTGMQK